MAQCPPQWEILDLPLNSVENISQDLVQLTTPDTEASASFDFKSEEREEIADVPAPTPAPALERIEEQSTHTPDFQ